MRILRLCFPLASFTSPSPPCCRLTCFTHCFGNLLLALKAFSVVLCGGFRRAGDFHTAISISTYLKGKACACCRSSCWLPVFFLAASSVCSTLSWNKRYKSAVRAERDSQPFPKTGLLWTWQWQVRGQLSMGTVGWWLLKSDRVLSWLLPHKCAHLSAAVSML